MVSAEPLEPAPCLALRQLRLPPRLRPRHTARVTAPDVAMPTGSKRSDTVTRSRSSRKSVAFKGRSVQLLDRSIDVCTVVFDGLDVEPACCDPIVADRGNDDPTHGEG